MEEVDSVRFLGVVQSNQLTWSKQHISALQRLHYLRKLEQAKLAPKPAFSFHRSIIETILTNSTTVWLTSCTAPEYHSVGRVVKVARGSP